MITRIMSIISMTTSMNTMIMIITTTMIMIIKLMIKTDHDVFCFGVLNVLNMSEFNIVTDLG